MATGGGDPLQKFIENQMFFQQFIQQQQQFGAQQALAKRQLENQEIEQFVSVMQQVQNPEEAVAMAEFFTSRNPEMAETFTNLTRNMAPNLATQQAGATRQGFGAMDPGLQARVEQGTAIASLTGQDQGSFAVGEVLASLPRSAQEAALAISQGRALTEAQEQSFALEAERLGLSREQLVEQVRQFGISAAQEDRRAGQADRGLDLQGADLAQRGELGIMQIMAGQGYLGMQLRSNLVREINQATERMQEPGLSEEERSGFATEIAERRATLEQLDKQELAAASSGQLPLGDIRGMIDSRVGVIQKLIEGGASRAERTALHESFDQLTQLLNAFTTPPGGEGEEAPAPFATPLGDTRSPWEHILEGLRTGAAIVPGGPR